jgi:hypothetical protein
MGTVRRIYELLEELIEAVEEENPLPRRRKLATVKEKVQRERLRDDSEAHR